MNNYGQHTTLRTILIKTFIAAFIAGLLTAGVIEAGHQIGLWNRNQSIQQFDKK